MTFAIALCGWQVDHSIMQQEVNSSLTISEPQFLLVGGVNSTESRLKRDTGTESLDLRSLRNYTGDISSEYFRCFRLC